MREREMVADVGGAATRLGIHSKDAARLDAEEGRVKRDSFSERGKAEACGGTCPGCRRVWISRSACLRPPVCWGNGAAAVDFTVCCGSDAGGTAGEK